MSRKIRYSLEFELDDSVFAGINDAEIKAAVNDRLPEDSTVGKCYSENLSARGMAPYVSVMVKDTSFMVDDLKERNRDLTDAVVNGVENTVGREYESKTVEGWS